MIIDAGLFSKCEMGTCANQTKHKLCLGKKGSVFVCKECLMTIAKQIRAIKGEISER